MTSLLCAHLELLAGILIECTVVVQDVDEFQAMANADLVIVGIVCRRDLYGAGTERHVHDDVIRDNGYATVHEGMLGELAV